MDSVSFAMFIVTDPYMLALVWNNPFSLKSVISFFNKHVADQTDACCKNLEKAAKAEKQKGTFLLFLFLFITFWNAT